MGRTKPAKKQEEEDDDDDDSDDSDFVPGRFMWSLLTHCYDVYTFTHLLHPVLSQMMQMTMMVLE